jgi:guanyl-specific ribonuclease Sa
MSNKPQLPPATEKAAPRPKRGGSSPPPSSRPPTAPRTAPIASPPPAPKVLQARMSGNQGPRTGPQGSRPAAPPPYRPQPTPKVLQKKEVFKPPAVGNGSGHNRATPPPSNPRLPTAPPVYRPQPAPKILQPKSALAPRPVKPSPPPRAAGPARNNKALQRKACPGPAGRPAPNNASAGRDASAARVKFSSPPCRHVQGTHARTSPKYSGCPTSAGRPRPGAIQRFQDPELGEVDVSMLEALPGYKLEQYLGDPHRYGLNGTEVSAVIAELEKRASTPIIPTQVAQVVTTTTTPEAVAAFVISGMMSSEEACMPNGINIHQTLGLIRSYFRNGTDAGGQRYWNADGALPAKSHNYYWRYRVNAKGHHRVVVGYDSAHPDRIEFYFNSGDGDEHYNPDAWWKYDESSGRWAQY